MLLNDVFERFAQDSPVSVMVRGLLENTLSPRFLDELFENVAERRFLCFFQISKATIRTQPVEQMRRTTGDLAVSRPSSQRVLASSNRPAWASANPFRRYAPG